MAEKGKTAKKVLSRILAAIIAAAAVGALFAGYRYGLFAELIPGQPSVPDGFIDENATHAFVEFIDIGQGDAVLIGSEGHYMLIDTGPEDISDRVIKRLVKEEIAHLDVLLISSPAEDHIGAASDIIASADIGRIIIPRISSALTVENNSYGAFIEAATARGIDIDTAGNESFDLGSCKVDTFIPEGEYDELNNYSVFVKLTHGENSFLFTGDGERPEEEEISRSSADLSADVLMAGDHGGRDSCTAELLSAVQPDYCVISCGKNNEYGYPNRDTLRRLGRFSKDIFITARDGSVRFDSDGCRFKVSAGNDI